MESIIIGGGKIGYNLLKILREKKYQAMMVEMNRNTCLKIADELDAEVICGDGTDPDVLRDAGIEDAEIVAAVTGTDEENLVICQIAKLDFHIQKTIARVNNPKNIAMFRALGLDRIVCSTEVIANMVEYELDRGDCRIVQTLEQEDTILAEVTVNSGNPWMNHLIKNLKLPSDCVISTILHGGKIIFPRGDTEICEDDKVFFITNPPTYDRIAKGFQRRGVKNAG
ncbi:MAG: NAD-binding protein [Oscillospiraceae bacterium]|nr:NAD-binding protein [Oscillospiraceae bacterium]